MQALPADAIHFEIDRPPPPRVLMIVVVAVDTEIGTHLHPPQRPPPASRPRARPSPPPRLSPRSRPSPPHRLSPPTQPRPFTPASIWCLTPPQTPDARSPSVRGALEAWRGEREGGMGRRAEKRWGREGGVEGTGRGSEGMRRREQREDASARWTTCDDAIPSDAVCTDGEKEGRSAVCLFQLSEGWVTTDLLVVQVLCGSVLSVPTQHQRKKVTRAYT